MNVVSFYVPRRGIEPRWIDYVPLLAALQASCDRLALRHVVLTDDPALPFELFCDARTPRNLMKAVTFLQWRWAAAGDWRGQDTLFVGADCLILQGPEAWAGPFDWAVTFRPGEPYQINTGCMMVRHDARAPAAQLLREVYDGCGPRWCDDQMALEKALSPMPTGYGIAPRHGLRVNFLPMRGYNERPNDLDHKISGAVAHFRGKTRKALQVPWAKKHLGV